MNAGRRINLLWAGSISRFFTLFESRYESARTAGAWSGIILVVTSLIPQLGHAELTFGVYKNLCLGLDAPTGDPGSIYVRTFDDARSVIQSIALEAAAAKLVDYVIRGTSNGVEYTITVRHTTLPTPTGCGQDSSSNYIVCGGNHKCSGTQCSASRHYIRTYADSLGQSWQDDGDAGWGVLCGVFGVETPATCTIKLSGLPTDVEPGKEVKNLRADVTCDGVPTLKEVVLTVKAEANTGGHNHHDSARPPGALSQASGISPVTFSFAAPAPAGDHVITAKCADNSCGEDTGKLWVGIKDLVSLYSTHLYTLVGSDTAHPNNHYLTYPATGNIVWLAQLYREALPVNPVLHLNDASLVRGGLFDIAASWQPPHPTHRRGTEIDIRANPLVHPDTAIPEGSFSDFEYLVLERIRGTFCGGKGSNIAYPGNIKQHYHVCLMGGNCCSGGN